MRSTKAKIGGLKGRLKGMLRRRKEKGEAEEIEVFDRDQDSDSDAESCDDPVAGFGEDLVDIAPGPSSMPAASCSKQTELNLTPKDSDQISTSSDDETDAEDDHEGNTLSTDRDIWRQVYARIQRDPESSHLLESYEQYLKEQGEPETSGSDLFDIQKLAKQKLAKLSARQLSFKIGNRKIVVREQVRKLVNTVLAFKGAVSVAIESEPHAALVWAGVLVILPFLERIFQQDEDAALGFERTAFLLVRFRVLEDEFLSPSGGPKTPIWSKSCQNLLSALDERLVAVYATMFQYQLRMVLQYSRSTPHRLLRDMVGADQWKTMLKDIEGQTKDVDEASAVLFGTVANHRLTSLGRTIAERTESMKAMQEETLANVIDAHQTELLSLLPYAPNAVFDSAEVSKQGQCHPGTQLLPLLAIQQWLEKEDTTLIFWLHGMAGTGKSSIAVTVAEALNVGKKVTGEGGLAQQIHLGGTFFLKQDDSSRNDVTMIFPTLARTFSDRIPKLRNHIASAIRDNTTIGSKRMQEQLKSLIIESLTHLANELVSPICLVIIIDALDECRDRSDVSGFLALLPKLLSLPQQIRTRFLVISRPESHIKAAMPLDLTYRFPLEKIPLSEKQNSSVDDITRFMTHKFHQMTQDRGLDPNWLSQAQLRELVIKADGLFIYATTICRFLQGAPNDRIRQMRVDTVVRGRATKGAPEEALSDIYTKVLSFPSTGLSEEEAAELYNGIRKIFAIISSVCEPVSLATLSSFLEANPDNLNRDLEPFHSIVNVPQSEHLPVDFFHLSFREFLRDRDRSWPNFWVDNRATNLTLFTRCFEIMNDNLHQDMCDLRLPGFLTSEIPRETIEKMITPDLQYSCVYWFHHLLEARQAESQLLALEDDGLVHTFFRTNLLYWLEVLSLLGKTSISIHMVNRLRDILMPDNAPHLSATVHDIWLFIFKNRYIIDRAPLQLYCSALIFSPRQSIIRNQFMSVAPSWITGKPHVGESWSSVLYVLEGHKTPVHWLAMSPDSYLMASGESNGCIKLWDVGMGTEVSSFDNIDLCITMEHARVRFSPDSRKLALWSLPDRKMVVIDITVPEVVFSLKASELQPPWLGALIWNFDFSMDSKQLRTVWDFPEVWTEGFDIESKTSLLEPTYLEHPCTPLALSSGAEFLVARLTYQAMEQERHRSSNPRFPGDEHTGRDQEQLAVYDFATGERRHNILSPHPVQFATISKDCDKVLLVSMCGDISIWMRSTGKCEQLVKLQECLVHWTMASGSPDTYLVATTDGLYQVSTNSIKQCLGPPSKLLYFKRKICFSADGRHIILPEDNHIKAWQVVHDDPPSNTSRDRNLTWNGDGAHQSDDTNDITSPCGGGRSHSYNCSCSSTSTDTCDRTDPMNSREILGVEPRHVQHCRLPDHTMITTDSFHDALSRVNVLWGEVDELRNISSGLGTGVVTLLGFHRERNLMAVEIRRPKVYRLGSQSDVQFWDYRTPAKRATFDGCTFHVFSSDGSRAVIVSQNPQNIIFLETDHWQSLSMIEFTGSLDWVGLSQCKNLVGWVTRTRIEPDEVDSSHMKSGQTTDPAEEGKMSDTEDDFGQPLTYLRELFVTDFRTGQTCRIVEILYGEEVLDREEYYKPEFSPDGRLIAANTNKGIILADPSTGLIRRCIRAPDPGKGYTFTFSSDSSLLGCAGNYGFLLMIIKTGTGETIYQYTCCKGPAFGLFYKRTILHDILAPRSPAAEVAFTPSGDLVALGSHNYLWTGLHVWTLVGNWDPVFRVRTNGHPNPRFSADSTRIIANGGVYPAWRSNTLPPTSSLLKGLGDELWDSLYFEDGWIIQGLGRLVWIPPSHRVLYEDAFEWVPWITVEGDTIRFRQSFATWTYCDRDEIVPVVLRFDLENTPLTRPAKANTCGARGT